MLFSLPILQLLFPFGYPSSRFHHFIHHPHHHHIHTFHLTAEDVNLVYDKVSYHLQALQLCKWKPPAEVSLYLDHPPFLNILNMTTTTLMSPQLSQGLGISGCRICLALIKEIGHYLGHKEDLLILTLGARGHITSGYIVI